MNLDTSRILNTDEKVLANALKELANSENTIDAARKYKELYKDQPLSFIIENSERIFVEPRKGLEFYEEMVKFFPLYTLCDELAKITNYLHENKDRMHPMLAETYGNVISRIRNRIHDTNCFSVIEDTVIKRHPEIRSKIVVLCDLLRKAGDDNRNDDDIANSPIYAKKAENHINAFNDLNKMVAAVDPIISLIYMAVHPRGRFLRYCARNIAKSMECEKSFAKMMESAIYVSMISSNELFKEMVGEIPSVDAKCILEGFASADISQEFDTYTEAVLSEEYEDDVATTLDSFIESVMADFQEERANAADIYAQKNGVLNEKLAIYESVLDIIMAMYEKYEPDETLEEFPVFTAIKRSRGITESVTVEDGLKIITEATASVEGEIDELVQEYTIDGRPGNVLNRHTAGTKYNEDITKGVNAHPKAKAPSKNGALDDDDDEENSETIPNSSMYNNAATMPSAANPNAKAPVKPKQGVVGTITNKAMDANAASAQKKSKVKAVGQGVANAGKAVLKVPGGMLKGIGNFAKSLDTMDDNRRKEYMIRPGFRKKIFKNIRVAAMYGATAYVSKLYLPIAWFARKMSKEKNKRIRNEFAAELETEIKVTDAKIEDANSKGDQEQRYQLMRIRDKLAKDLERVKYNSKYI